MQLMFVNSAVTKFTISFSLFLKILRTIDLSGDFRPIKAENLVNSEYAKIRNEVDVLIENLLLLLFVISVISDQLRSEE